MGDTALQQQGITADAVGPAEPTPPDQTAPEESAPEQSAAPKGFGLLSVNWRNIPGGRIALVLAVASFLITAWLVVGHQAGQAVSISYGKVACSGAKVRLEPAGEDGVATPTISPRAGMRCSIPVRLTNNSPFDVRVTQVMVPGVGPRSHATVVVPSFGHHKPTQDSGVDAVFRVSEPLAPGASTTLHLVVQHRATGCVVKGEVLELAGFPTLDTRAFGVNSRVVAPGAVAVKGTSAEACAH